MNPTLAGEDLRGFLSAIGPRLSDQLNDQDVLSAAFSSYEPNWEDDSDETSRQVRALYLKEHAGDDSDRHAVQTLLSSG